MIDEQLLQILACPEDKSPVHLAEPSLIEALNAAIAAGRVQNRAGHAVSDAVDGGLVRADEAWLYPIRDDIPVMLVEEAIPLPLPQAG